MRKNPLPMERFLKRSALLVSKKQPFIDWVLTQYERPTDRLRRMAACGSVYLVAPDPEEYAESAPIALYYKAIFEDELNTWTRARSVWPQERTLKVFHEWFEVVPKAVIRDLETGPIEIEEFEPW